MNRILGAAGLRLERRPSGIRRSGFSRQREEEILLELVAEVDPEPFFVDVGAADGVTDSNTAALALRGWPGVFFEADPDRLPVLAANYAAIPGVTVSGARITPHNVVDLLRGHGVPERPGVVDVDIDSWDRSVLDAILGEYRPAVVMAEINEKIPPPLDFEVLYDPTHSWSGDHFFGMSIVSLKRLARARGYHLVTLEYNNAFLIDGPLTRRPDLGAERAWREGYLKRPDRRRRFPWNADVESAWEMSPEEAVRFFEDLFRGYEGRYALRAEAPEDERPAEAADGLDAS